MIANTLPQSLIDNPILSQWVAFEESGRVRVGSGKVEIGQGILTALSPDRRRGTRRLAFEQVRLVSGQTDVSPAEGFTSGSYSIAVGGASIRLVCAEVRALFLDRAAGEARLQGERTVDRGRQILRAGKDTGFDYWSLAGEVVLERRASGTAPVKRPSSYRIVGRNVPRVDLPAKVSRRRLHPRHRARRRRACPRAASAVARRAAHVALDEKAVRRAASADRDSARGRFRRFHRGERDRRHARRRGGAHAGALGGRHAARRTTPASLIGSRPAVARPHGRKRHAVAAPGERAWSKRSTAGRSSPMARSVRPARLAEFKNGELKVWSHTQGRPCSATGSPARSVSGRAGHGVPPPGLRRLRPQHRRRRRASTRPSSRCACRAGRSACSGRARTNSPARRSVPRWRSACARCSTSSQAGGLDDRNLERPARPASGHERQLATSSASRRCPIRRRLNELNDVPDDGGGGATRNAVPIYDLPRHRLIHHLLPRLPLRTSSLRGLGAWANVFAIESFIDELAEIAGEDPVSYRLSLLSDPRAPRGGRNRGRDERLAGARRNQDGAARGFGFARYKNIAPFCRRGGRGRGRRDGSAQARVVRGRRRPRDLAGRRAQSARRRHHHGRELRDEGSACGSRAARSSPRPGRTIRSCDSRRCRIEIKVHRPAGRADARPRRGVGRTDRGGDRQRGGECARQAHPPPAAHARAHHGGAAGRIRHETSLEEFMARHRAQYSPRPSRPWAGSTAFFAPLPKGSTSSFLGWRIRPVRWPGDKLDGHDDDRGALRTINRSMRVGSAHHVSRARATASAARNVRTGKPIRIIVGLAAGGATDVMARLMAQKMSENLRTTVFVENRAGGNFIPALRDLTGSPPDGHTLFFISTCTLITQPLHPVPVRSDQLTPVTQVATGPLILVVRNGLGVKSLRELIERAKQNPGKLVIRRRRRHRQLALLRDRVAEVEDRHRAHHRRL